MGSMLDKPKTEFIDAEEGEGNGQAWGVSSIQGWRTEMEDQHVISVDFLPNHSLYAVFDGHGGKKAAIFAASELVCILQKSSAFAQYAADQTNIGALRDALQQSFVEVDAQMRAQESFNPKTSPNEQSGCTAIATVVTPTHIVTANAGDSRGLLCRSGGANVELSFDHKPFNAEERRRIEAAGGCVSMKRVDGELAVSRALGDFSFKDADMAPELCKVTAHPDVTVELRHSDDEFIVLACDGIWDVMTNEMVIAAVTGYCCELGEGSPRLLCEELIEECLAKNSRDNMSAVVVMFQAGRGLVKPGLPGVAGLREKRAAEEAARQEAAERQASARNPSI